MIGGGGNDTYFVSQSGDLVVEAAGEGSADIVFALLSYTLVAEVENLTLAGTAAINGTGNVLDNVIVGNSAANTLTGGLGDDTLTGGAGNDVFKFIDVFGQDTVTDYVRGQDDFEISRSVFSSWADLFAHTADDGTGNAIISADIDHTIVLVGIAKADLLSSDFHLV